MNPLAPTGYQVDRVGDGPGLVAKTSLGQRTRLDEPAPTFDISLPLDSSTGRETLRVSVTYYYCREGAEGVCKFGTVAWLVPIELSAEADVAEIPLRHSIQ